MPPSVCLPDAAAMAADAHALLASAAVTAQAELAAVSVHHAVVLDAHAFDAAQRLAKAVAEPAVFFKQILARRPTAKCRNGPKPWGPLTDPDDRHTGQDSPRPYALGDLSKPLGMSLSKCRNTISGKRRRSGGGERPPYTCM